MGRTPSYVAMYVTRTEREIKYFATVKGIVSPEEAVLADPIEEYTGDRARFEENKKVVVFEPRTLYELEDPIPFSEKYPQGHRYTTLDAFRNAQSTDDLF
jgi:hypothetical protein